MFDQAQQQVWDAMGWQPSNEDLVLAEAVGDQMDKAIHEAAQFDCRYSDGYAVLKWVPDVYERIQSVMLAHHITIPGADYGGLQTFIEVAGGPGMPRFDKLSAEQWALGLFGLVAGREREIHVLGPTYPPWVWLEGVKRRRRDCRWNGPECADYSDDVLTFASASHIVAVPTCFGCRAWLLAGGSRNSLTAHLGL